MSDEFDELYPENDGTQPDYRPLAPRGKRILGKFLFFLLIFALLFLSFVFIQQTLLDLDAKAQVYATQTAAVLVDTVNPAQVQPPVETISPPINAITTTPLPPNLTPTFDSNAKHTATIAALLTQMP